MTAIYLNCRECLKSLDLLSPYQGFYKQYRMIKFLIENCYSWYTHSAKYWIQKYSGLFSVVTLTSVEKILPPDWFVSKSVGTFSSLVISVGKPNVGKWSGTVEETGWANQGQQASKQCSTVISVSVTLSTLVPVSRFLPWLLSVKDCTLCDEISLFLPMTLLVIVFITATAKWIMTPCDRRLVCTMYKEQKNKSNKQIVWKQTTQLKLKHVIN